MTRTELAAFRRMDNRRHALKTSVAIIRTWILVHGNSDPELFDRIAAHCERALEDEKRAEAEEDRRARK